MLAGDGVEIGWWPSARIAELQAFIDAEWKPGHILATDEALLRWQHPRDEAELSVVGATANGRPVGILGVIPVRVSVHGRPVDGAWLTTWVVTPEWRPHQLGLRLLEFVTDRYDFVGTIGGNDTTLRILGALRFHVTRSVPRWVLPLSEEACARVVGADAAALASGGPSGADRTGEGSIRSWSLAEAEAWDAAWSGRLASTLVGTWRDAEYVGHRYVEHPGFDYRIRVARDAGGLATGLVVSRIEPVRDVDVAVVRVVEALGDAEAVERLAGDLARDARGEGAAFADFYCTSLALARGLERAGFVREESLPATFPSRFQPLEPASRPLTAAFRLSSWSGESDPFAADDVYFTRSDCDQDRPN